MEQPASFGPVPQYRNQRTRLADANRKCEDGKINQPQIPPTAPPQTFLEYIKSFGPGIIVVLTWLGAGDIVEVGVAGGNYGYALMWIIVLAILMRFVFVSLIAKYQLCNQRGEGVLDGLARLHPAYPVFLLIAAVVMGHIYGAYMTVGIGEACVNLTGIGEKWQWAVVFNGIAVAFVVKPIFARVELLFMILLAMLSVSFLGTALWVGPNLTGILEGTFSLKIPPKSGPYDSMLVAIGMVGAVGGSMMNLVYPYFIEGKGWKGPQYRRVQMYDFLLAIIVMLILDLALWTLGAELLHPEKLTIEKMDDLPRLLSQAHGEGGRVLFYVGIFAAIYSSLIGHALGLGYLGSHAYARMRHGADATIGDYRHHRLYRWIAVWCLVSPLAWTFHKEADFVTLTLVANAAQVVLIPPLAGGLWWITADPKFIGAEYRNRWWENLFMLVLFGLAIWGAWESVVSVSKAIFGE